MPRTLFGLNLEARRRCPLLQGFNRKYVLVLFVLLALFMQSSQLAAQVIKEDFTRGTALPGGWTLSSGSGAWETSGHGQSRSVSVTGDGESVSYWWRPVSELEPDSAYRIRFWAMVAPGSTAGTVISGLDSCNHDFAATTDWQSYSFVFTTPDDLSRAFLRLGQWHLKGTVFFSDVTVSPVQSIYGKKGALRLGSGEWTQGSTYSFATLLEEEGTSNARPLVSHTAAFNTDRWVFTGGRPGGLSSFSPWRPAVRSERHN